MIKWQIYYQATIVFSFNDYKNLTKNCKLNKKSNLNFYTVYIMYLIKANLIKTTTN